MDKLSSILFHICLNFLYPPLNPNWNPAHAKSFCATKGVLVRRAGQRPSVSTFPCIWFHFAHYSESLGRVSFGRQRGQIMLELIWYAGTICSHMPVTSEIQSEIPLQRPEKWSCRWVEWNKPETEIIQHVRLWNGGGSRLNVRTISLGFSKMCALACAERSTSVGSCFISVTHNPPEWQVCFQDKWPHPTTVIRRHSIYSLTTRTNLLCLNPCQPLLICLGLKACIYSANVTRLGHNIKTRRLTWVVAHGKG